MEMLTVSKVNTYRGKRFFQYSGNRFQRITDYEFVRLTCGKKPESMKTEIAGDLVRQFAVYR